MSRNRLKQLSPPRLVDRLAFFFFKSDAQASAKLLTRALPDQCDGVTVLHMVVNLGPLSSDFSFL